MNFSDSIDTQSLRSFCGASLRRSKPTPRTLARLELVPQAVALACAALATAASAQSAADGQEYVVTASRVAQPQSAGVRPVTVITADDIRAAGVSTLAEVLRTLGGAESTTNGGPLHASSVFLRGANGEHTVLLVDGVRVGSATLGTPTFSGIPLALIERIEIVQGPASSLYGADAIGGVVQVFTRSASRSPGAEAALTIGSHGLYQLGTSVATRVGSTEVAASAQWQEYAGFNATTPANLWSYHPDTDASLRRALSLRVVQPVAAGHSLIAQYLQSRDKVRFDDGEPVPGAAYDALAYNQLRSLSAGWQAQWSAELSSKLSLSRSQDDNDNRGQYPGLYTTVQDQAQWLAQWHQAGQTFSAGADWRQEEVQSTEAYDQTRRTTQALVLGWQGQLGAHRLQADWRSDRISSYGRVNTGQIGWRYALGADTQVRASLGNAFHAPSFNQLFYPFFGNPDLKAERSVSSEIGLDSRLAGVDLGLTVFQNKVRDLISYTPIFTLENVDHARIRGLNLSAASNLGSPTTRLKANLTLQQPINEATDRPLPLRARAYGGAQLSHRFGAWRLGADLGWAGRRFDDGSGSEASHLGAYALWGLSAGWTISPDWSLDLKVKNATDKDYSLKAGYATAGREAQLTLRWTPALP